jgi:hypothetical protein
MFIRFGLSPHEKLSDSEVELYVHEWIRGPGPGHWLKRLWSESALRPRVIAAARAELENWDGTDSEADESGEQRRVLKFAASLSMFPRRKLQLFLTAAHTAAAKLADLTLQKNSPQAAKEAFSKCDGRLLMSPVPTGEFSVLEPTSQIGLSALLFASFTLEEPNSNLKLIRDARPILPLLKSEDSVYFREVSRTPLLRGPVLATMRSLRMATR